MNPFEKAPGKPEKVDVECTICKGTGKKDDKDCRPCSGTGRIRTS